MYWYTVLLAAGRRRRALTGRAEGEVGPVAARRGLRVLDVAVGVLPDAEDVVDVLLPEPLVLVGDGAVRLGGS